jgi:hypothetical protein
MGKDKSILKKITDRVKDIAEAANRALEAEQQPARKADDPAAVYVPLAADGLVSDPMMLPPTPVAPAPRMRRGVSKRAAKKASRKTATKAVGKPASKVARKSAARRSGKSVKANVRRANKKTARRKAAKVK